MVRHQCGISTQPNDSALHDPVPASEVRLDNAAKPSAYADAYPFRTLDAERF